MLNYRYLSLLEKNVNTMVCGVFLCLLTGLCSTAFSLVMVKRSARSLMLAGSEFQSLGRAIVKEDEYEEYESVRDAAWASDWVGAPLPYQRCILFIIAKSNQEFYFTAGKFVSVSHDTMMNVQRSARMINQSFSFFMFLLTMKDKSDGKA
ncbi:hypothetical protein ANN_17345 [Periplaneta americana]|uniref:Uncharacterized protein n=1 Tax=Periplaneta americana TaxID=6978 RepID=A0ABQ8STZ3_PERAM|nr:hypothetical protein ANN_17345 [Periplaneta americana]